MSAYKFEHAVTQAFRTSGGKQFGWRLIFWTTAALTIVSLITWPMIMPHYGDLLAINQQNMQAIMGGEPNSVDSRAMNQLMLKMAPTYGLLMLGYWLTWVACEAALHRKVLNNSEAPRQPLRLGQDELRVWFAQLGVFGLIIAIYVFGLLALMLVIGIFAAVAPFLGALIGVVGVIAYICLLLLASVRLAPAAGLSIANNKTHVLAAKGLTKGRFWTLLPAYIVVFIGGYVLMSVIMMFGVGLVTGNPDFVMTMSGLGTDDPEEVMAAAAQRLKNPLWMLVGILSMIAYCAAYALWMVSLIGISSHAVKAWRS